jgi:hypothetical protein
MSAEIKESPVKHGASYRRKNEQKNTDSYAPEVRKYQESTKKYKKKRAEIREKDVE